LKVALVVVLTTTPVAPEDGDVELTAGAGGAAAVVKVQEYGAAMDCPAELVAPLTVAV
jgi:3-hydroxy-3-methylglutaryl CoA synthase